MRIYLYRNPKTAKYKACKLDEFEGDDSWELQEYGEEVDLLSSFEGELEDLGWEIKSLKAKIVAVKKDLASAKEALSEFKQEKKRGKANVTKG